MNNPIDTDQELTNVISTDLLNDPRLSSQPIEVSVGDGIVRLSGKVDSYRRKLAAHEMASCYEGIRDVINDLSVEPSHPSTDEEVAADVRRALDASADVTKGSITVKVVSGIVTLEGTCGTHWERMVAEDVARSVRGVRNVNNLLVVNLIEKINDAELRNAIQAALNRTRGLRDTTVKVAIVDRAAVLSGEVTNLDQKIAAQRAVSKFGILHIRNEIVVQG